MKRQPMRLFTALLSLGLVAVLTLGMAACSGSATTKSTATLVSISVTPYSPANLAVGSTQRFVATGIYSDGTTPNITSQVTWTSSNNSIASIATGLATGVAVGSTSITATESGITSPAVSLPVIPALATTTTNPGPALVSIAITQPSSLSINLILAGTPTQQFVATGTYSDGSTRNITTLVTWVSSATDVASINTAGLAAGLKVGETIITATMPGFVSTNHVIINVTAN